MNYKIIVSPIASKNIEDAVEYYIHKASKKVASDFLKEYRKTYKALQISPFFSFMMLITNLSLLINFRI